MQRYFIEVAYKGTAYSGFQKQRNANTVQAEVEQALQILYQQNFELTGSSRTDAGVHALQNFFHFDADIKWHPNQLYNLNALLPADIIVKNNIPVGRQLHARFDAISREYEYHIYDTKNPFLRDVAYYYPYKLDIKKLEEAAAVIKQHTDFTAFSKRNTQVKTFECLIEEAGWLQKNEQLIFRVKANRFLRGMARGLTATMLKVGRGIISLEDFVQIIESKDCAKTDFSAPAHGLFLIAVNYKENVFFDK